MWIITFDPSSGSDVILAGEDTTGQFDQPLAEPGVRFTINDLTQESSIVRATQPARFNRLNRTISATFSTERSHADHDAALLAACAHVGKFDLMGNVTFKDSASSVKLTIYNARVKATGGTRGALTEWSYEITGTPAA